MMYLACKKWSKSSAAIDRLSAAVRHPLKLALILVFVLPVPAALADPIARIVTRVDAPIEDTVAISVAPEADTPLNRSLEREFRDALDGLGRLAETQDDGVQLLFNAETVGTRSASDATIGSVVGDAEGRLDIELKLWSSGGGNSLFQGARSTESITTGHRLNALLVRGETVYWQGYVLADTRAGDAAATLGSLVQTLVDRLDISVDETVPLR